jgi:glycyl-tRNA synthetase
MAHYASDCWDAEIESSYGWVECVGCADRSCFDLTMHSNATGERLVARERLPAPLTQTVRRLEINKRELGQTFKSEAKEIGSILECMDVDKFGGKVTLKDGREIDIPPAIATPVSVTETIHVKEYVPAVIEPSFGIGRILYSLLEHSFYIRDGNDEQRAVLALPACVAPTKCLITPISAHQEFTPIIREMKRNLGRMDISCNTDESSTSIGKRYSRNDEVGVPFAITIDFDSLKDNSVTLRERDSTQQVRLPIQEVCGVLKELVNERSKWSDITAKYTVVA